MRKIYGDFLRQIGSEFESVSDGKGGKDGGRWDQSWLEGARELKGRWEREC
jgi:hypothetical protein